MEQPKILVTSTTNPLCVKGVNPLKQFYVKLYIKGSFFLRKTYNWNLKLCHMVEYHYNNFHTKNHKYILHTFCIKCYLLSRNFFEDDQKTKNQNNIILNNFFSKDFFEKLTQVPQNCPQPSQYCIVAY